MLHKKQNLVESAHHHSPQQTQDLYILDAQGTYLEEFNKSSGSKDVLTWCFFQCTDTMKIYFSFSHLSWFFFNIPELRCAQLGLPSHDPQPMWLTTGGDKFKPRNCHTTTCEKHVYVRGKGQQSNCVLQKFKLCFGRQPSKDERKCTCRIEFSFF